MSNNTTTRCFWRKRYTSGSHLGRNDGHPEPRVKEYEDNESGLIDLCCDHNSYQDEHYEYVREVANGYSDADMDNFVHNHDVAMEQKQEDAAKKQERVNDELTLVRLAKKLGKTVT